MTRTVETENDSRVDASSEGMAIEPLMDFFALIQGFSGAKRMSPEEQRRFFRNSRNFFD